MSLPPITTRADVQFFIERFYKKVLQDELIGFIFTKESVIDWGTHIPRIVDFWETILLDTASYQHNAMEVHYSLNRKVPLTKEYFDRWLMLFNTTLDECFSGGKVELAKKRAASIGALMLLKMENKQTKNSLL